MDELAPVRLMHHDPRWRQEFEQTRSNILWACEGWVSDVQHIGSTALPGLIARPTIDAIATVDQSDGIEPAALLIEGLNYRRISAPTWADQAIWLIKPRYPSDPANEYPTHSVLLVHQSTSYRERAIRMRDYLRSHPEKAIAFEETKVQRWRASRGDPEEYERSKAIFFTHLEDQLSG